MRRLLPAGSDDPLTAEQLVSSFALGAREQNPQRDRGRSTPHLLLNMVSTVDGRASIGGRSAPMSNPADRALFHELRVVHDGVMVGAGTARLEHYRRIIRDEERRKGRTRDGLEEEPLACIVSASLALTPLSVPLLAEPQARVVILTPSEGTLPSEGVRAQVRYIRAPCERGLDLRAALRELFDEFGVRTLLCEGGPHLNAELLAAGLVDELLLCVSPQLAAGRGGEADLRILAGGELDPPLTLELLDVAMYGSHLFLRYGVLEPAEE